MAKGTIDVQIEFIPDPLVDGAFWYFAKGAGGQIDQRKWMPPQGKKGQ